jgi:hypothetical protein
MFVAITVQGNRRMSHKRSSPFVNLSLSDSGSAMTDGESKSLIPPAFHGTIYEDAAGWWRQFNNYCTYTGKTTIAQVLVFFALLMRDNAAVWLESLKPPLTKRNFTLSFW